MLLGCETRASVRLGDVALVSRDNVTRM